MAEVADRILNHEPEAIGRYNYACPGDVEAIVRKALREGSGVPLPVGARVLRRPDHARGAACGEQPAMGASAWRGPDRLLRSGGWRCPSHAGPRRRRGQSPCSTFTNITGNAADEWIGQGIAESLTADFAKIGGLTVIPREQVFELQRNLQIELGRGADDRQSMELGPAARAPASWSSGAYQRLARSRAHHRAGHRGDDGGSRRRP